MSWSRQDGPRGYHHGNLREALIRAALELIAKKGPAGFTFAEAARWAGVSPAAPYRHFRDRDDAGRPHSARPRDALGRPLPRGSRGVARIPDEMREEVDTVLAYLDAYIKLVNQLGGR